MTNVLNTIKKQYMKWAVLQLLIQLWEALKYCETSIQLTAKFISKFE